MDRTDPQAVAAAYLDACHAGHVDAALALISDDRTRDGLRRMVDVWRDAKEEGPWWGWDAFVRGSLLLPLPADSPIDRQPRDVALEGDRAQVTFALSLSLPQTLVLTRDAAGNWGVDVLESAKAADPGEDSFVAGMFQSMVLAPEGPGTEGEPFAYASYAALSRLGSALAEYAEEHEGCLPLAEKWVDEIELYVLDRSAFRSPGAPDLAYGFAMNAEAGGKPYGDMEEMGGAEEAEFLVLFEWPGGERNATVTPEQLAQTPSFWPDGSVGFVNSWGQIDVLPKDTSLEQFRAAQMEEDNGEPDEDDPEMQAYRCAANLELLAMAARKYAREHGGLLPAAESWQDDLAPYVLLGRQGDEWDEDEAGEPDPYHCPAAPGIAFGYAINAAVAGRNALDLTNQEALILFFESDLNVVNAAGDPERDQCDPRRHKQTWAEEGGLGTYNQVAYVTGDTAWQRLEGDTPEAAAAPEE